MFKIRRSAGEGVITFAVSGRIEEEHLLELQELLKIESDGSPTAITLDLEDVKLVDREAIKFLATSEAHGIILKNTPSYVREWIETGRATSNEPES